VAKTSQTVGETRKGNWTKCYYPANKGSYISPVLTKSTTEEAKAACLANKDCTAFNHGIRRQDSRFKHKLYLYKDFDKKNCGAKNVKPDFDFWYFEEEISEENADVANKAELCKKTTCGVVPLDGDIVMIINR
jgi:hypothetical protein